MQPKSILGLTLVLSGGLFRCSSIDHNSAKSNARRPDLYLHLIASFEYPKPPQLIVSAPIRPSSDFDIPMDQTRHLKGRVEPRNGKYLVHFEGLLCSGTNVFNGEVSLEQREEPGPQPYDDKAPFICQPHFILSSHSNPKFFLQRQAAAEKKEWQFENPLTAKEVARVKKKFQLLRPGLTKDEVFALLGLSRYGNQWYSRAWFGSGDWDRGYYQLAKGEVLVLVFDHKGFKTMPVNLPWGEHVMMLDYSGNHPDRRVVQARLGAETWPK